MISPIADDFRIKITSLDADDALQPPLILAMYQPLTSQGRALFQFPSAPHFTSPVSFLYWLPKYMYRFQLVSHTPRCPPLAAEIDDDRDSWHHQFVVACQFAYLPAPPSLIRRRTPAALM